MLAKASEQHLRPIEITAVSIEQRCQEVCGGKRRHPSKMYTRIGLEDDKKESLATESFGVFPRNWVAPMN